MLSPKRKALPMVLLSIMIPISLLVTFRLTGVLHEPLTPETITIDEVVWQIERPSEDTLIKEEIEKTYTNDAISMFTTLSIHRYYENAPENPYWHRDGIAFQVDVNATAVQGSIVSVAVEFNRDTNSTIYINPTFASYHNVTVTRIEGIGTSAGVTYIGAKVIKPPCSLMMPAHWVFTDQNLENHQLKVSGEVTYSNGETYQTIVAPIVLKAPTTPTQGSES